MTSPPLGARVLAILERDTGRTDDELAAELGVALAELSPVIGRLYRQRRADRCAGYLVAVPPANPAAVPARRSDTVQEDIAMTTPQNSPGAGNQPGGLMEAALWCAERGWHVFPLRAGTKRPALHGEDECPRTGACAGGHLKWEQRATTDPGIIRRCWARGAYNIGLATGPSGLVVIDLDKPKPGQAPPSAWAQPGITDGADVLAALCDRHGQPFPAGTFTVRTRRGGLHLYFAVPPGAGLRNTVGDAAGGLGWLVDTRGCGGYVVAPGSVVDLPDGAGRYEVTNDQAPAALPGWLAGLLTPPAPDPLLGCRPSGRDEVRDLDGYARTALKRETDRVRAAAAGGRNRALNKAAYHLGQLIAAGALPEDLAREELYAAASVHFAADPPVTPAEARAAITAGIRRRPETPPPARRPRGRRMTGTNRRAADGAVILGQLHAAITRYVILPSAESAVAVALWIAASHAQPAWAHAPRLVIRAPEKRCGKSRLLDIVEGTCHAPLITVNASPAAVYRAIGGEVPPTLLVDEADTIFGGKNAEANEDLRGLLNAGHQRNRPAIRWDSATRSLETIPTFAMAALAGIGAMPDTIEDRAVVIRMRRRAPGETVAPFRHRRDRPALTELAGQLAGWLGPHLADLEKAEPVMPLEDRAADTWEPLIAVADLAGCQWPDLGRHAAVALTTDRDQAAAVSDRIRLLADCRAAFGDADALPTTTLIARLRADPEAPWCDYGPAGITAMRLGSLLREYDIRSANIRFGEPIGQVKGYYRADFTDAWTRYCPESRGEPSQPSQPSPPSSAPGRLETWDGSSRPKDHHRNDHRDGSSRPGGKAVPGVTCDGTAGTAGTPTPRFGVINGGAA